MKKIHYKKLRHIIYVLLKKKSYEKIYEILYLNKKFKYIGQNISISKYKRSEIVKILFKDKNFASTFISLNIFARERGIRQLYKYYYLFLSNNIMNNNNYVLSKDDILYYKSKKLKNKYGTISYFDKSFFSEALYNLKKLLFKSFINQNINLIFRCRNDIYYFNKREFYSMNNRLSKFIK